jgi:hypothetical protein
VVNRFYYIAILATGDSNILKITHIGNPRDNRIKNLQWVTQTEYTAIDNEFTNLLDIRYT